MSNNQPTWNFSPYDPGFPRRAPNELTPARKAAVAFENQVRTKPVEHGALFRSDGSLLQDRVGTVNRVTFSDDVLKAASGCLFTHNHPGGFTISNDDVLLAQIFGMSEVRVVTDKFRFMLRPDGSWPSRPAIVSAYRSERRRADADAHGAVDSGEVPFSCAQWEIEHRLLELVARKLHMHYDREVS